MGWILIGLCGFYGISALVGLITLPTEFNASVRAKKMLDNMLITDDIEEKRGVRRVLSAAAQTYVASFAISLIYLIRIIAIMRFHFGRD
jgi:Zn-dependent membrane protease YugP